MIDFRNLLAHQYDDVSTKIVWDILTIDLPPLLLLVEEELAGLGGALPQR